MTGGLSLTNVIRIRPRSPDEGVQWDVETGELGKEGLEVR